LTRHSKLKTVTLSLADGSLLCAQVVASSANGKLWKLRFAGYDSPESAQKLVNAEVLIEDAERLPAPEGQYYFSDLGGFSAVDREGKLIGTVKAVLELPSVNAFEVELAGGTVVLVPWTDACVGEVRMEAREVEMERQIVENLAETSHAH
jgi:16S rRNA processing protein RimM